MHQLSIAASSTKRLIKKAALGALFVAGILTLYLRIVLNRRAVVLTYHRVLPASEQDDSFSSNAIVVTPETFDLHMRLVKRFLTPITPEVLESSVLDNRPLPPRACLITFDDGWYDNLAFALPILQRHGIPAVLFVATDFIGSDRCFWQERMARLLFNAWERREGAREVFSRTGTPWVADLPSTSARQAIRAIVNDLKGRPFEEISRVMGDLERVAMSGPHDSPLNGADRFLSWDDVRNLHRTGLLTIASHTKSHTPLTKLDDDAAIRELTESHEVIRREVGANSRLFAYPNGDCDERTARCVRASGYTIAFSTAHGHVTRRTDALRLKRINMHQQASASAATFLGRIAGL